MARANQNRSHIVTNACSNDKFRRSFRGRPLYLIESITTEGAYISKNSIFLSTTAFRFFVINYRWQVISFQLLTTIWPNEKYTSPTLSWQNRPKQLFLYIQTEVVSKFFQRIVYVEYGGLFISHWPCNLYDSTVWWILIRGTQRPNASKYARSVSDGFLCALKACLVNLELP